MAKDALSYQEKWKEAGDPRADYFFIAVWMSLDGEWFATGEAQKGVTGSKQGIVGATWWKKPFDGLVGWIEERIERKRDLYFSAQAFEGKHQNGVHEGKGAGHDGEHAIDGPIAWGEFDHAKLENVEPALLPSYAWITSPGSVHGPAHWHGLWMLDRVADEETRKLLVKGIDPKNQGSYKATQWLRVPGTMNYKYDVPSKVRMKWTWEGGHLTSVQRVREVLSGGGIGPAKVKTWAEAYAKYEPDLKQHTRANILEKAKQPSGRRSEIRWSIATELMEVGASIGEATLILKGTVWCDGDDGLQRPEVWIRNEVKRALLKSKGSSALRVVDDESRDGVSASYFDIKPISHEPDKKARWVWHDVVAQDNITIFDGAPEHGKTWAMFALMAAVADGSRLPSFSNVGNVITTYDKIRKGPVVYFSQETTIATARRRLKTFGCEDVDDRFHHFRKQFSVNSQHHLSGLMLALDNIRPRLLVFDTMFDYTGASDSNKQNDMSAAMARFRELAERYNAGLILSRWFGKGKHDSPGHQALASIAIRGAARQILMFRKLIEGAGEFAMIMDKTSDLSEEDKRSLTFYVNKVPDEIEVKESGGIILSEFGRASFRWGLFGQLKPSDAVAPFKIEDGRVNREAVYWLYRAASAEWENWKGIIEAGESAGYDKSVLKRARIRLEAEKRLEWRPRLGFSGKDRLSQIRRGKYWSEHELELAIEPGRDDED
jgi:hypothetical protein